MATQDISQLVVEVKSKGIQTAANQLDKLATASDKAEKAVKKLGTAVVGVNGTLTGGVAQASALVAAMTTLTVVLNRMASTQARVTTSTRANNEAMREGHALARGLSGSLGALWVTYGNLAGMGVGIALGASLKGVVSVGKDVEHTLEQIRVLGQATTDDISKMSATISDMGRASQGPKEVAEALQVLTLAGLNAKQAMQGVQAALNLSIAGGVGIEKSAETLVQVGTALGYTADGYDHVADVVAKAAAVSMSSVDSISNAFKSAAAVGEVYGASLQDIALGLASIANLGIQGTSAGTALKNFYKDLSASTQKVTGTLKAMKLNITDFRDAQGFMLPLLDVVKKLDEGFNSLDQKQKKIAEVKMFSQQGVREYAILNKLLHTASEEVDALGNAYKSKLDEMADHIEKSAAFATLSAIAMSQTTTNQLKSVGNTLQSTFTEVFQSVAPQIGEMARALRSAFNSAGFKEGLTALATGVANVTKYLVEHSEALKTLIGLYIGWKVVEFAAGIVKMALAFDTAAIAARGFWTALGPIAIAVTGLTLAWQLYKAAKDKALDNKPAENNLQEYADRVKEAAKKELAILELKKKGFTEAQIARDAQLKEDIAASDRATSAALAGVETLRKAKESMWAGMSENDKKYANMLGDGSLTNAQLEREAQRSSVLKTAVEYVKAERAYTESMQKTNALVAEAEANTKSLVTARTELAKLNEEEAKKNRFISNGTGVLPSKGNKAGENAEYEKAIQLSENVIKQAYRDVANYRAQQEQEFKAGKIGELTLINNVADAEADAYKKVSVAIKAMTDKANSTPDKQADVARFEGEMEKATSRAEQAQTMRGSRAEAIERESLSRITALRVKTLEDQGKFEDAARLKWSAEGKLSLEQAQADLEKYGDKFPWLAGLVEEFASRRDAAINAGKLKEDVLAFDIAMLKTEGTLKGLGDATYGRSISATLDAATTAAKNFEVALADAKTKRDALKADADKSNSSEASKKVEEANKAILAAGDKMKTKFVEVGQTITDSLGNAFGSAGTALGKLNEAMLQFQYTENATAEDRMKQYGDMAGAASGFFDKQSKGYKALNGIAQVFHVAEVARTLVRTAASIAAGAAKFFEQSGWGGFAGVAAMGAVMAGLGYVGFGGSRGSGGRTAEEVQKVQGTGGVFGDAEAKSESITKSIETLKSNSDIMLPLTQGMYNSLKNIEASMTGLTNLVLRSDGVANGTNMGIQTGNLSHQSPNSMLAVTLVNKLVSLWGSTKQNIVDSGIQMNGSVSDLQSGKGYDQYASVDTTKSSWFGLSKKTTNSIQTQGLSSELSQQFSLIFTSLEDTLKIAGTVLGKSSDEVSKAIDGLVINTSVSLKDLKGKDLQDALNGVISKTMDEIAQAAFPAMDAFRQVGEGYAQTVIRVASAIEQSNVALEKLGVQAVKYTDITNKTGDISFEIVKQSIALKEGASGVGEIMGQIAGSMNDVVASYTALVEARSRMEDMNLGSGLNFNTLKGAGDLKSLTSSLSTYYDKFFSATEKAQIETVNLTEKFEAIGYKLPSAREELRAWVEAAATAGDQLKVGQLLSLAGAFDTLATSLEKLSTNLAKEAYDDAVDAAEQAYRRLERAVHAEKETLQKAKDELQTAVDGMKSVLSSLADAIKDTTPKMSEIDSFEKAMNVITGALTTVNGGGDISKVSGLEDAFKMVSNHTDETYSTLLDYQVAQARANAVLTELNEAGKNQLSEAEKALEAYQMQLDKLDQQLETSHAQLDALKGIDNSILSVADALVSFQAAIANAMGAKVVYDAVKAKGEGGTGDAIESLYKSLLGRASDEAGKAFWVDAVGRGASMSEVAKMMKDSDEYKASNSIPSLDVGTNNVPHDMLAMIHAGERVMPPADNAELNRRLAQSSESSGNTASNAQVVEKLDDLIKAVQVGDVANVQKANEMFKILKDWNASGMPPEKQVTE